MNYIILEKSSSLRAKAREDLKGKWLFAIGVMIIANICTVFIPTVIQSLSFFYLVKFFYGVHSRLLHSECVWWDLFWVTELFFM